MSTTTDVRERPILFSGEMVRAILEGRKCQTRRVVTEFDSGLNYARQITSPSDIDISRNPHDTRPLWEARTNENLRTIQRAERVRCPYGRPGDRLWVRETWRESGNMQRGDGAIPREHPGIGEVIYAADRGTTGPWRPSIYMPRWASRITLEVTGVRVERVQQISEDDAQAEGAFYTDYGRRCYHEGQGDAETCPAPDKHHDLRPGWSMVETSSADQCLRTPRMAFANLWNSINAKRGYGWDENPWCWCISFRRAD